MRNINKSAIAITLALVTALPTIATAATVVRTWLRPGYQRTMEQQMGTGRHTISVNGDGYGDLDLYIYDGYGRLVGKDEATDDNPELTIDVYKAGQFSIKVSNHGDASDEYTLSID